MMDEILAFAIAWMPMFVIVGLLLFVVMRTGRVPKDYAALAAAQLEQVRRQTQILDRIATALEKANNRAP
jgi:hypothetical protein